MESYTKAKYLQYFCKQTRNLSKKLHVQKLTTFCKETHCCRELFTQLEKIYTAAGRDGRAEFQICLEAFQVPREQKPYSSFKLAHLWKMYRVKNEIMLWKCFQIHMSQIKTCTLSLVHACDDLWNNLILIHACNEYWNSWTCFRNQLEFNSIHSFKSFVLQNDFNSTRSSRMNLAPMFMFNHSS